MRGFIGLLLACLIPSGVALADMDAGDELFSVRRFVMTVGANDGGPSRVTLRYAVSDAEAVSKVFRELGGVEREDQILLADPGRDALLEAIAGLATRIEDASETHSRVELILYYSGHSDERGLLLGGERVAYPDLREAVNKLPAHVRIIILDSCASGAFTRLKGGQRRAPFLMDASADMRGHAYLTSASDDEAAQESDRIEASFFTHSLVSGLRGAADMSQDNRVTLNEAYQFAFYETLARTEGTSGGAQHPAYDIHMVGAGDLVMTDLRGTSAGLVLKEGLAGRVRVRDEYDALVVELMKPQGRSVELGLEPGPYRVIVERDGSLYGADVVLVDGHHTELAREQLAYMSTELATARGDKLIGPALTVPGADQGEYLRRGFSFSLWPGLSTNGANEKRTISDCSLNLTVGSTGGVNGFELGILANWDMLDVRGFQIAGGANIVEGSLSGLQFAGLMNRVYGNVEFLQVAGLINSVGGNVNGVQAAIWANIVTEDVRIGQASALVNYAGGNLEGVQFAGWINGVRGDAVIGQAAGLASFVGGSLDGVQFSGLANVTLGDITVGQVSSIANYAHQDLVGVQFTNIVNVTRGELVGAQATAFLNVVRERLEGVQFSGLANAAGEFEGAQIGLLNLSG